MYILYLDESGAHGAKASYSVLAGLAVFEREIYWFSQDMDNLQKQYFPAENTPLFFHATQLRARRSEELESPWNGLTVEQRRELKDKIYDVIRNRQAVLFGCAVERRLAHIQNQDPYERALKTW